MDVTALSRVTKTSPQPQLVTGFVSKSKPAPAAFGAPLFVVLPSLSASFNYGPCKWGTEQGASLPKQGAEALVAFDSNGTPIVVWWDGTVTDATPPAPTFTPNPGDTMMIGTTATDRFVATDRGEAGFMVNDSAATAWVSEDGDAEIEGAESEPVFSMQTWTTTSEKRVSVVCDAANIPLPGWEI